MAATPPAGRPRSLVLGGGLAVLGRGLVLTGGRLGLGRGVVGRSHPRGRGTTRVCATGVGTPDPDGNVTAGAGPGQGGRGVTGGCGAGRT
jgi:hypothetical protein